MQSRDIFLEDVMIEWYEGKRFLAKARNDRVIL